MISIQNSIDSLERYPAILRATLLGCSNDLWLFRPSEQDWSILEITCHLVDEEKFDFPARIKFTLDGIDWTPIDPEGWAVEREYQNQDPEEQLVNFERERAASIQWLNSLDLASSLNVSYANPHLGDMSVGDLFYSWAAHDLLHLRQITKRLFQWNEFQSANFNTSYAGSW